MKQRLPLRRDGRRAAAAWRSKNPVSVTDLHATIFTAMGISPKTAFDVEKRPFYATEDGKGQAVTDCLPNQAQELRLASMPLTWLT